PVSVSVSVSVPVSVPVSVSVSVPVSVPVSACLFLCLLVPVSIPILKLSGACADTEMMSATRDGPALNRAQEDTLLVGVPPEPRTGTVATRGIAAVVKSFLGASPVTWIVGARGSGRTTAVRAAALACDRFGGICRVDCGAVRLEESLSRVAAFFEQLGHGELQDVLEQRSTLESKAAVLAHLVRETSVLLWWEDADKLSRGRRQHPALRVLLDRLTTPLGDAPKGHVVLTAPTAPANVSTPLELIAPTPAEALALWSS